MNASSVQTSSSNTSSDFSIEKILSDDVRSHRDCATPSWLCCTRYQPPRLPRAASTSRARRSGRHARVPFTSTQAAALEAAYSRAPYLAPPALRALAAALHLRDDRIKIWFQNRRARERREKSFLVNHPHSIALPATTIAQRSTHTENWRNTLESHPLSYDSRGGRVSEAASSSCNVWRPASSSDEESITSPPRSETPLDVETVVD